MIKINPLQDTYFIATNNNESIVHYGLTSLGQQTETGQPNLELFDNEQEYLNRLIELGIDL